MIAPFWKASVNWWLLIHWQHLSLPCEISWIDFKGCIRFCCLCTFTTTYSKPSLLSQKSGVILVLHVMNTENVKVYLFKWSQKNWLFQDLIIIRTWSLSIKNKQIPKHPNSCTDEVCVLSCSATMWRVLAIALYDLIFFHTWHFYYFKEETRTVTDTTLSYKSILHFANYSLQFNWSLTR